MFRTRLRELREAAGYRSQQAFADAFGVAQSTVGNWEAGKREPNYETTLKLAKFFHVTLDYLLGNVNDPSFYLDNERILKEINSYGEEAENAPTREGERQAVKIPVLGSVPAGIPIEAIEDILDWEEIPASMCRGGLKYFALQVQGDSMWPDYLTGDVVIIRKTPICESGDDCMVYINGCDATLKQVKLGGDGSLSIIPRNQNYAPKTYTAEEVRDLPVSIAGVVVELRRKVGRR